MELKAFLFEDVAKAVAFVALYFVLFLFAKWVKDVLTPYKLNEELTKKDNVAVALTMAGYYLGVSAIFVGALLGPTQGLVKDLSLVAGYSALGLVFLNASRLVNDKVILRKFCNVKELVEERNVAVGAVHFGTYVATGLIAAGAVTGTGGGVLTAVVFFVLGQFSLFLFSFFYDLFTPYSIHEELAKKNVAAGIALGGSLIALGIIILNGVSGNFVGWEENLVNVFMINIAAFIFLPIVRVLMDKLVIPGDDLNREIVEDRNVGAGLLEAVVAISFAVVLKVLL